MKGEVSLLASSLISMGDEDIDDEKWSKSMHIETSPALFFLYY